MAGFAEKCSECGAIVNMVPQIAHIDGCSSSAIWYHKALEIENALLKEKVTDLKDRLRAALMKPQWKRSQK